MMAGLFGRNRGDSTWDRLRSRGVEEDVHYQDVHTNQQIEYSSLGKPSAGTGSKIFAAATGLTVYVTVWFIVTAFQTFVAPFMKGSMSVSEKYDFSGDLFSFGMGKFVMSAVLGVSAWGMMHAYLMQNVKKKNIESSTSDLKQATNDAFIQPPELVQSTYALYPNVGAHSGVSPTSLISHAHLSNKGVKKVRIAKRSPETVYDEDGDVVYYKGQELFDDNGEIITEEVEMIDEAFAQKLYDASGVPKKLRKLRDPSGIDYNKGGVNRDKLVDKKAYDTAADLINDEWELPLYEPQRPSGAYVVDTAPVNTMVLAITRAGKGQTIIEPTIDMWMREKRPNNIVVNDPKGELLVKNFVRASRRGYQVVQFNLINPTKTNIYNPLGLAAEAAREGDFGKCAAYVEDISEVFFPTDGGDDPMWANAAANAFKRSAYGMIDFYLEEERELRKRADLENMDADVLEQTLDNMWGKVTLYNCYQFFVQLSSKKMKSPLAVLVPKIKPENREKYYSGWSGDQILELFARAEKESELWNGEEEMDMMSLYFEATARMPRNDSRSRVLDAHNSLVSMAGSDKMIASVYGIAVTAMSFFTDPTISRLTSGPPSQNTDLASLSFPRRFGVRFDANFAKRYSLAGLQAKWDAFADPGFQESLGKDFEHSDTVSPDGWARYYFDGKFPEEIGYVRLRLINDRTGVLNRVFYFKFKKGYQTNLSGRTYIKDPVTDQPIVYDGVLTELVPVRNIDSSTSYETGSTTFKQERLVNFDKETPDKKMMDLSAIMQTSARYCEQPKIVFLVTPPHLMKYAKLILILLRQLVNLNFDKSYMTKENQKPLYTTRFMLDEFGNLQSEGKGVGNIETFLSIGLGQQQQFTLILQTMAQLLALYGEGVDKIMQGNINNLIFLKSTDDQMIEQLSKMSGERHVVSRGSRTITKNMNNVINQNDGTVSYTDSSQKEATLSYNDFAFIGKCQSIVFRSGDMPIWNRTDTALPMSFALFGGDAEKTIVHYGHTYSLQTVPTLSEASGFDIRLNQPDFREMYNKRMKTGWNSERAREIYMKVYGYDEFSIQKLDPNVVSIEIMDIADAMKREASENMSAPLGADSVTGGEDGRPEGAVNREAARLVESNEGLSDNAEYKRDEREALARVNNDRRKLYAGGRLSPDALVTQTGVSHQLDELMIEGFIAKQVFFEKDRQFEVRDGSLYLREDGTPLIVKVDESENLRQLNEAGENVGSRVYMDGRIEEDEVALRGQYRVEDAFYKFLVSMDSWRFAEGRFEQDLAGRMQQMEEYSEAA